MANEFWINDRQWAVLEPLIPMNRRGVKPKRNREIISGIVHVLRVGCRWRDVPEVYGPHTTVYNRFNRWSMAGIWQKMLEALVDPGAEGSQSIDSTSSKAHRCAAGGQGGPQEQAIGRSRGGRTTKIHAVANASGRLIGFELTPGQKSDIGSAKGLIEKLPTAALVLADTAYDSDKFRKFLDERGSTPVIKPNPTRKNIPPFDKTAYKGRNVIERAFSHLKDWRRVATRYDKLARNFRATVTLAILFRWWV
jgi:transposase